MQNSPTFTATKSAFALAFLTLASVFTGCSATGPFRSHSAFKQSLPSGYGYQNAYQNQSGYGVQGTAVPQWQSANYPPVYAPQYPGGYGATAQPSYGYQPANPESNQGLVGGMMSPFVSGTYTSGSC